MQPAVTVPWLNRIQAGPDWSAIAHEHAIPEILVVLSGQLALTLPDGRRTLRAGDVAAYPAGLRHVERSASSTPVDLVAIGLDAPALPGFLLVHDRDARIRQLATWLSEGRWLPEPLGARLRDAHAASLLAELARLAEPPGDQAVIRVREHLRRHLARAHNLAALARLAGLGRSAFCRRYRLATGRTPMDDLRHLRVQAAADLLLATREPLQAIAAATGFCDVYHFSRLFSRKMGVSPGRYRGRR